MQNSPWLQNYTPLANNLALSAAAAALPIVALLYAIGVRRLAAWKASLWGLGAAALVALVVFRMPLPLMLGAAAYGFAFGTFPIFWVVLWAIVLYRMTLETGQFDILKRSIEQLTTDRTLQGLLIAFAFGAFLEGAAGFGTPVAVAAAILTGLGFSPFYASAICLLANTAPVAFGSIGIPLITLATTTGLPLQQLASDAGRLCAPVSFFLPAYLVTVMGGTRELRRTWPAALLCGGTFAVVQFAVSNFIGPYLTDILSSLTTVAVLIGLLRRWRPSALAGQTENPGVAQATDASAVSRAWSPYLLLITCILLWSLGPVNALLTKQSLIFPWPGLHNVVQQAPPLFADVRPYPAVFRFRWLAESGTACFVSVLCSAVVLRVSPRRLGGLVLASLHQLRFSFLSITLVLALAFVMNYSGATATLGLAFAATSVLFPLCGAFLGWLGVFLTGSDTSSNALFGGLQTVTAGRLGLSPVLMAAANTTGGVMGKMISLQSIAVAAAATALSAADEPRLFRFTLRHSLFLTAVVGALVMAYAYLMPGWVF